MSSEVFDTYHKEYTTLRDSIKEKLGGIASASPDQKKLLCSQCNRDLEEADEIVGQMEVEVNSLNTAVRNRLTPQVRQYKDDIKNFKKELTKASKPSERDALLGSSSDHTTVDFEVKSMDQRSRLIQGTERLQDGSRRLEEAQRMALETEQIGINTLGDLNRQREQILRTRDTLSTADAWIGKSQGLLKNMHQRMMANKMIACGIIFFIIAIIAIVVYLKWFS